MTQGNEFIFKRFYYYAIDINKSTIYIANKSINFYLINLILIFNNCKKRHLRYFVELFFTSEFRFENISLCDSVCRLKSIKNNLLTIKKRQDN